MVIRHDPWPAGTPCWVDLAVDDTEKARTFYGSLFGWDMPAGTPETGGYMNCSLDGHTVAGVGAKMQPDQPSVWTTYLAVEDAEASAAKITAEGGSVLAEPMDVMDLGRLAIAVDPAGAVFGLWQAGTHSGAELVNEPGTLTWNEQMSRDWETSKEFYAAVFGWGYHDLSSGDFEYATFTVEGRDVGGIGLIGEQTPSEVPAQWRTYFAVADADQAVARVRELGGKVVAEPWDTPFGRMASVWDDQGVPFQVSGPTPATS